MQYGYASNYGLKTTIARQVEKMEKRLPGLELHIEGSDPNRPVLSKLLRQAKKGDMVVFYSISVISENKDEAVNVYRTFQKSGVQLMFLQERYLDTDIWTNESAESIFEAQVEALFKEKKEIGKIRAMASDMSQNRGRKPSAETAEKNRLKKEEIRKRSKTFNGKESDIELIESMGISRAAYYLLKREMMRGKGDE